MALNKALLKKVRDKILRVPEAYEQSEYGEEAPTPCGTRACIAGHALIESGACTVQELNNRSRINPLTGLKERISVEGEAQRVLGLTVVERDILFSLPEYGWPHSYERRFRHASSSVERAKVAADYIDHIIRTGEV